MFRCYALSSLFCLWAIVLFSPPVLAEQTDEEDLAKVQGLWERKGGDDVPGLQHAIKQIAGTHEVVTYYGPRDRVLQAHEVDFKLERRGGVKIFTFFNRVDTEGPNKGNKSAEPVSYIYRADDYTYVEVWGFLPEQAERPAKLLTWVKKPPQSPEATVAQQQLQGEWLAHGEDKSATESIFGNDITFHHGDEFITRKGDRVVLSGIFRVDPTAKPQAIDLIILRSPNGKKNGQTLRGIYELNGEELRWASGAPNRTRPHEFVAREGSTQIVVTLKREPKPAAAAKP
jgi:uncharacterized protein (TIGR03067 family)